MQKERQVKTYQRRTKSGKRVIVRAYKARYKSSDKNLPGVGSNAYRQGRWEVNENGEYTRMSFSDFWRMLRGRKFATGNFKGIPKRMRSFLRVRPTANGGEMSREKAKKYYDSIYNKQNAGKHQGGKNVPKTK